MSCIKYECNPDHKFRTSICNKDCVNCDCYRRDFSYQEISEHDKQIRADERAKVIEMLKIECHPCLRCPSYSTDECDSEEYFEDCCVSECTIAFSDITEFIKRIEEQTNVERI